MKISDSLFLGKQKAAFLAGENCMIGPKWFEWQATSPENARFVTDSAIKCVGGKDQIAWLLEPFWLHPENYWEALSRPFDAVLTSNLWFAENFAYRGWRWVPHGGSWIGAEKWGLKPKTNKVSMLLSAKDTMPGHKLCHEIARRYGDRIDIMGDGVPGGKRVDPLDAYGPYEYSIVVENERTPGYFTEKLINCLSQGTIPIYWGAPNIASYIHGISPGLAFRNIEELNDILDTLMPGKWYDRGTPLRTAKDFVCAENWMFLAYPDLFHGGQQ